MTGLVTADTASYWSGFGEVVILGLIQVGGFGTMTFASLLGLLVSRRLGLRTRITAAAETRSVGLGDVRSVLVGVARTTLLLESLTSVLLGLRFWLGYDYSPGRAAYLGVFHAISAFNNAGFVLWSDSLTRYVTDPWICLPIAAAVIVGGLGFPVLLELRRQLRPRRWSLHARMTVSATVVLLVVGTLFVTANEWRNPDILSVLMFIGGGSAGTAGGIKVTTFVLLVFVIWAEVRGERDVHAFDRRITDRAARQALTVALLSVGITADLRPSAQLVLATVMFLGRLGPITLVSAGR